MNDVGRRTVLAASATLTTISLAGCATVKKELGLVSPGDVIEWDRATYNEYGPSPPPGAPDRDRGAWWRVRNVSEEYIVAEAAYTLVAKTDSEAVIEETVEFSDLAPDQSQEWYFDISEEVTNDISGGEIRLERFSLK